MPDGVQGLLFIADVKPLLRRGVHLAVCALVPGTAIGNRQDQRLCFAWRAKDRVDITNWEILIHQLIVSELRHGGFFRRGLLATTQH